MKYNPLTNQQLFWDVKIEELSENRDRFKKFILERILEHGDFEDVYWLLDNYERQDIANLVTSKSQLSRKTRNFWVNILNLRDSQAWIEFNQSQKQHKELWKY